MHLDGLAPKVMKSHRPEIHGKRIVAQGRTGGTARIDARLKPSTQEPGSWPTSVRWTQHVPPIRIQRNPNLTCASAVRCVVVPVCRGTISAQGHGERFLERPRPATQRSKRR